MYINIELWVIILVILLKGGKNKMENLFCDILIVFNFFLNKNIIKLIDEIKIIINYKFFEFFNYC